MADKKTELMAAFFEQCQNHGYTDMHDDTQSLKAKVIATDLNLKYGDIVSFYEKAQKCYDQVQAEKVRAEQLRKIQQQKNAEEAARRSVRGERLVTLANNVNISRSTKVMHVYIRPDKSIYTMADGSEFEGAPAINLHAGGVLLTTFHPSKSVYTGATVGGITTGGVHYTKESYSQRVSNSDKGYITAKISNIDFTIAVIQVYQCTKMLFKRDPNFQALVSNDRIICQQLNSDTSSFVKLAMTKTDYASQMNVLSVAADQQRLPFDECREITNVLVRIIHGPHPPSDQEAYASAVSFSNAKTAADLKKAIDLFRSISDFRDSADRANALEVVYEEVLQAEKEQAILEKEETHKRNKKIALITGCLIIILTAAVLIGSTIIKKQKELARLEDYYSTAVANLEAGNYTEAIVAFEAIEGYKDSAEKITTCKQKQYEFAQTFLAEGQNAEAAIAFGLIADYQDAREQSFTLWSQIANWESISAGWDHTVGLKADGTVVATEGAKWSGGLGGVSEWTDIVAISAGQSYAVGLKADGTVVAAGSNGYGECNVSEWTDIVAISAGRTYTVGLKADGTVVATGYNENGECNVSEWTDIVAISAGGSCTVGLKVDGTVVATGYNGNGRCNVSDWTDIVAISAGGSCTVGLKVDGTVVATGYNGNGGCNVSDWTDIVAISAGGDHTVGLKADGTVVATGYNGHSQCKVSDWTDIVAISAFNDHTVGLKADGTVVATGDNFHGQCDVSGWKNIKLPN